MVSDVFDGPRELLRWGNEEIDKVHLIMAAFSQPTNYQMIEDSDLTTFEHIVRIKLLKPLPREIVKHTSFAAMTLKSSLDHTTYAATKYLNPATKSDLYFPWGDSREHFLSRIAQSRINPNLHQAYQSFDAYPTGQGYEGGDDIFRALAKATNITKHRFLIGTGAKAEVRTVRGSNLSNYKIVNGGGEWQDLEHELEIIRYPWDAKLYDLTVFCYIDFRDYPQLTGLNVLDVLRHFSTKCETIINAIEAEVRRVTTEGMSI